MNFFFINSEYAYHGNGIPNTAWHATNRLQDRIDHGNIVSVSVGSRKVELTLSQRYELYKANRATMQAEVYKQAAEHPDEPLYHIYNHVAVLPESVASHEFLDMVGCPRRKGEEWKKSTIEKLWEEWGCGMEKQGCV